MPDLMLKAKPPLDGFRKDYDGVSVAEVTDRSIVSIATPDDGQQSLDAAMTAGYQVRLPEVGASATSDVDRTLILGLQKQQVFLLCDDLGRDPVGAVNDRLNGTAYLTDQSDSWVLLQVSGDRARVALERISPIDLHPQAFPVGAVARTSMEHLGVIMTRTGENEYLLMSACSSAHSFLHAVETSIQNVS